MVREARAYEAFRALGVKAPNTGYAFLTVNGEVFGTYLNVETMDEVALGKRFGKFAEPEHLYEGEYGADVGVGPANTASEAEAAAAKFEVDEGSEKERGDLEALIAAVNGGASGWLERVQAHADLGEMTRMWAVERYIGHWDGYSGYDSEARPEVEELLPNNYFLYGDSAGRFQMLPWGTDQTWDERLEFDHPGGALFDGCLADSGCAALYRAAAEEVLKTLPGLGLSAARRKRCDPSRTPKPRFASPMTRPPSPTGSTPTESSWRAGRPNSRNGSKSRRRRPTTANPPAWNRRRRGARRRGRPRAATWSASGGSRSPAPSSPPISPPTPPARSTSAPCLEPGADG